MALKWWPQANWTRTIAELLSELRGELTSLQPMDSKDIRWNKTANGMEALLVELPRGAQAQAEEAEVAAEGGGGSAYTGYCRIVDASSTPAEGPPYYAIQVVDPVNQENDNYCEVNGVGVTFPADDAVANVPPGFNFVYLHWSAVDNDVSVYLSDIAPVPDDVNAYTRLGSVTLTDGAMTIVQRHYGVPVIIYTGGCSS